MPDAMFDLDAWMRLAGRLHPLLVHFPIGLILTAAAVECAVAWRRRGQSEAAGRPGAISPIAALCLGLGVLGAAAAAGSGWTLADREPLGGGLAGTVLIHRWLGVGALGLGVVALGGAMVARRWPRSVGVYRTALVMAAAATGATGHFGGTLVHGERHLLSVFDAPEAPPEASSSTVAQVPHPVLAELETACLECHGQGRVRGGLRLDTRAAAVAASSTAVAIVPGDPAGSELMRRITLPVEHGDFMPKGGDRLPAETIAQLEAWILSGAPWTVDAALVPDAEPADADGRAPVGGSPSEPMGDADPLPRAPADTPSLDRAEVDAELDRLRAAGVPADRISRKATLVDVRLSVLGREAGDADLAALAAIGPAVATLDLSRTAVTDAGLGRLTGFDRLRRLDLGGTGITSAGIASIAELPAIEILNLHSTAVDDSALLAIGRMTSLRRVHLWNTRVSPAGVELLRAWRSDLEVDLGSTSEPVTP